MQAQPIIHIPATSGRVEDAILVKAPVLVSMTETLAVINKIISQAKQEATLATGPESDTSSVKAHIERNLKALGYALHPVVHTTQAWGEPEMGSVAEPPESEDRVISRIYETQPLQADSSPPRVLSRAALVTELELTAVDLDLIDELNVGECGHACANTGVVTVKRLS